MLTSSVFLFSLLLFNTYLRYFEVGPANIFFIINILAIALVFLEERKIIVKKKMILLFLFNFYVFLHLFFLSDRYPSFILISTCIISTWIWSVISEKVSWDKLINITLFLFFIHMTLSVLQKSTGLDAFFISQSLGFFNGIEDGQVLKHRVPGLTFISGDFYAPISFAVAYLFKKHLKLFPIIIALILYVNTSKAFIPTILILLIYDFFYVRKFGINILHLFSFIIILNIAGFGYSIIEYINDPTHMSTFSSRAVYLIYLTYNIESSPIFGIGFDNFKNNVDAIYYSLDTLYFAHNPHNVFIKFLSELGVVGFSLFIIALLRATRVPVNARKDERVIILSYAIFLILAQLSFHNFHFMADLYIYIGLLIGTLGVISREKREPSEI